MAKKRKRLKQQLKAAGQPKIVSVGEVGTSVWLQYEVLLLLFMSLVVLLLYSNSLQGPFIFDDIPNIRDNPHIRITSITPSNLIEAGFESRSSKRPFANISFALNYYFHQYDVFGYHLVNVIIHILTGLLLYCFVKMTLQVPALRSSRKQYWWIPLCTALIWLAHPIQTQAVSFIVQRMTSMATMFTILSLVLYVRGRFVYEGFSGQQNQAAQSGDSPNQLSSRNYLWFFSSALAWLLALGCKEISAILPFFVLLYEWYFFQDLDRNWLRRKQKYIIGALVLFGIVALLYLGTNPVEKLLSTGGDFKRMDFSYTERVLTQFRVVVFYLSLLVFPHPSRLNLDHYFSLSSSLFDPFTTVLSLGFLVSLVWLGCRLAKKDRLLSFCIFWFFGTLLIESSIIPLALIYEHRLYMPSTLVSLFAVMLIVRYIKMEWIAVTFLCCVIVVFSFWTYERNWVWGDDLVFWSDVVSKSPQKAKSQFNLGIAFQKREKNIEAEKHFQTALRLEPYNAKVLNHLGAMYTDDGRHEKAAAYFSQILQQVPDVPEVHFNLAVALQNMGKPERSLDHYNRALQLFDQALGMRTPTFAIHSTMANILFDLGRFKEATEHYGIAIKFEPGNVNIYVNMGVSLANLGNLIEATEHFSTALRMEPDDPEVYYYLGLVYAKSGKDKAAKEHFLKALQIKPDYAEARYELARYSSPSTRRSPRRSRQGVEYKPAN